MMTSSKTINLNDVEVRTVGFASMPASAGAQAEFIVEAEEGIAGDLHGKDQRRATGINLDGCERRFFLVYCEDCFSPCLAIVRADDAQEAEERFVDELPWARVSEEDMRDYEEADPDEPNAVVYSELLGWSGNGIPYDRESVQIREVRMVSVELA